MSENIIETEGLGKRYGSFWALKDCSIQIPGGSICALVGANGAGKTTLVRQLAGLSHPSSGRAIVNGRVPGDRGDFLSEIGYLAQEIPLYSRWTVSDHLTFGARMNTRWDSSTAVARLEDLRIPLDRATGKLSGGMRAQVALALALSKQPKVLILDEPVAALDPLARRDFLGALTGAVAEADGELTILMSSHLLADLERVCDHLVLMADGVPVLCDDIDALLSSHKLLSGPAEAAGELESDLVVIDRRETAKHASLLVRMEGPTRASGWQVEEAGLEEIVLGYLTHGRSTQEGRAA